MQVLSRRRCVDTNRHLAAALDTSEESPFGHRTFRCRRIVEKGDFRLDLSVITARLNGQRPLSHGGQDDAFGQHFRNARAEPQALQPRHGENGRIELAAIELLHARIHVAAQALDLQVGAHMQQLGLAAQAGGTDLRALRQLLKAPICIAHKGIARLVTLGNHRELQACGHLCRHILEAVHREVDFAVEHGLLQLFRKEPLAADFGQRCIEDLVALGLHELFLDGQPRILLAQALCHVIRLPACQLTAARTDKNSVLLHWYPSPLWYRV